MGIFLPTERLPRLSEYRYSSQDNSLLSQYILGPYWRRFVLVFPKWLAPNLITLSGLVFIIINLATLLYYNPTFDNPDTPRWVYVSCGLGLFMYQTFDACDGAQARRTQQGGPLGELFDHGVDALNTTLGVLVTAGCLNFGYGWYLFLAQFATLCNFYLSTWEEYHTGTLYLSAFSGPVEGIIMLVLMFFYTAYAGPDVYQTKIAGFQWITGGQLDITVLDLFIVFCALALAGNIIGASRNVIKARKHNINSSNNNDNPFWGLAPFFYFFISTLVWVILVPDLIKVHALPFAIFLGLAAAFMVGGIIVAHLTKSPFPYTNNILMWGPSIGVAIHLVSAAFTDDVTLVTLTSLFMGLGGSLTVYGFFVYEVVEGFTAYLDIYCLTIKHPKAE